jgi:hypothetical protein
MQFVAIHDASVRFQAICFCKAVMSSIVKQRGRASAESTGARRDKKEKRTSLEEELQLGSSKAQLQQHP